MSKPFTDVNETDVKLVTNFLKGKRLEKFLASIAVLDQSMLAGQWIKHGKRKAESGFYQGLMRVPRWLFDTNFDLAMCLQYGRPLQKIPVTIQPYEDAWIRLANAKAIVEKDLDEARPRPVITPIGLSPKVTKTLQEMVLDIDVDTVEMAEIAFRMVQKTRIDGTFVFHRGKPVMEKEYYVKWPAGCVHGASRFANSGSYCEACSKHIPSGLFVPVHAVDRKNGKRCSFWLGLDCAKSIFGIKDVGVRRNT